MIQIVLLSKSILLCDKDLGTQSKHSDQYPSNNRETNNKQYPLTKQTKANFPTKSLYKHSLVAI